MNTLNSVCAIDGGCQKKQWEFVNPEYVAYGGDIAIVRLNLMLHHPKVAKSIGIIAVCKDEITALRIIAPQLQSLLQLQTWDSHLIFVDGNSTDGSYEFLSQNGYMVISQSSPGLPQALRDGLNRAAELECSHAVMFQPDGNCRPEDLPRIVEILLGGQYDLVIGSRYLKALRSVDDTVTTFLGNSAFRLMYRLRFPKCSLRDPIVGYRGFPLTLLWDLDLLDNSEYRMVERLLRTSLSFDPIMTARSLKAGLKVIEVDAPEGPRLGGKPKRTSLRWGIAYSIQLWFDNFVRFCAGKPTFPKSHHPSVSR